MGLVSSLFSIGHLYLSGIWQGLKLGMDIKKTCSDELGVCAQKRDINLGSIVDTLGGHDQLTPKCSSLHNLLLGIFNTSVDLFFIM